jgi:hypothetical protein
VKQKLNLGLYGGLNYVSAIFTFSSASTSLLCSHARVYQESRVFGSRKIFGSVHGIVVLNYIQGRICGTEALPFNP